MSWLESVIERLQEASVWNYQAGGKSASEPAAWTALALEAHGASAAAERPRAWLADLQGADGSVRISAEQADPHWPTGLAVLAWCQPAAQADGIRQDHPYAAAVDRAIRWMLTIHGKPSPRSPDLGHDTTLVGWPWVEGTHTWLEPTAMFLLALKTVGLRNHPRAREGVQVLLDRQLPEGGCNYGNTSVLGQWLMPHLEPSGLALCALGGEKDPQARLPATLAYVERSLSAETTLISLAYGLLGLAAFDRWPVDAESWLGTSLQRSARRGVSIYRLALAAVAALGLRNPLRTLSTSSTAP